jgi:hypothetical protein
MNSSHWPRVDSYREDGPARDYQLVFKLALRLYMSESFDKDRVIRGTNIVAKGNLGSSCANRLCMPNFFLLPVRR